VTRVAAAYLPGLYVFFDELICKLGV